jgi:phosphonate dehydrogenase
MNPPKVVITDRVHEPVHRLLAKHCEVIANTGVERWPAAELLARARAADSLLIFAKDKIDDEFLAVCRQLKIIAGAIDDAHNIDLEACSRRGVWVAAAAGLAIQPTAELGLALSLALIRKVAAGDRVVRGGDSPTATSELCGGSLLGKTVGIIGMGKVGQAFARLLAGFSARIIYDDPVRMSPVQEAFFGIGRASLDQVLSQGDLVVVAVPLNPSTSQLVNEAALNKMKEGSYLVNVSRGPVVNEAAVADALKQGRLAGYAADLYEAVHPDLLDKADRTVFTPDLGAAVDQVRLEMEMSAARNILQALRGEKPRDAINEIAAVARKLET